MVFRLRLGLLCRFCRVTNDLHSVSNADFHTQCSCNMPAILAYAPVFVIRVLTSSCSTSAFSPFFSFVTYVKFVIYFFPSCRSSPRGVIRVTRLLTLRHGAVVFLLFPFPLSLSACPRPLFGRGVAITPVVLFRFPNTVSFAPPLPSRWRCSGA